MVKMKGLLKAQDYYKQLSHLSALISKLMQSNRCYKVDIDQLSTLIIQFKTEFFSQVKLISNNINTENVKYNDVRLPDFQIVINESSQSFILEEVSKVAEDSNLTLEKSVYNKLQMLFDLNFILSLQLNIVIYLSDLSLSHTDKLFDEFVEKELFLLSSSLSKFIVKIESFLYLRNINNRFHRKHKRKIGVNQAKGWFD